MLESFYSYTKMTPNFVLVVLRHTYSFHTVFMICSWFRYRQ